MSVPGVYAKLLAAQRDVEAVSKTGHNEHFNYAFVEEHVVLAACKEALHKHGLLFTFTVRGVTDRAVKTAKGKDELLTDVRLQLSVLDPEDGSVLSWRFVGRGQDNMDKGVNKALVAGIKYGLLKALMVPTGDDTESSDHDQRTDGGNAQQPRRSMGGIFSCPDCRGPMWDNRQEPGSARQGGKKPDFKCKNTKCNKALWGYHPDEPRPAQDEPQGAGEGEPEPQPPKVALEDLLKRSRPQLEDQWAGLLAAAGFDQRHPAVWAYALADDKVRDDPASWVKDNYAQAIARALRRKDGVTGLLQAALLHLCEKKPADAALLQDMEDLLRVQRVLAPADAEWYRQCMLTGVEPIVTKALAQLRGLVPEQPAAPPVRKYGPEDDLPF